MLPDSGPWATYNRAGSDHGGQGDNHNRITLDFEQALLEDLQMVDLNVLDSSEDERLTSSTTASEGGRRKAGERIVGPVPPAP